MTKAHYEKINRSEVAAEMEKEGVSLFLVGQVFPNHVGGAMYAIANSAEEAENIINGVDPAPGSAPWNWETLGKYSSIPSNLVIAWEKSK